MSRSCWVAGSQAFACLATRSPTPSNHQNVAAQGAQLAQACLSFDFVGTLLDDSAEDVTTIQVGAVVSPSSRLDAGIGERRL